MSLGAFLTDEKMGSWADEMEDMPVSDSRTGYGGGDRRTYSSTTGTYGSGQGGYSVREELPLPDKPPYTVHLGNLSFDATVADVTDFFAGCECTNVRIIEDKMEMKPKGFGYAEFATRDGLKQALTLNGSQFQGRNIRISVADPPKDRGDRPEARELNDWSRKGPLPDLPTRGGPRRESDRGFGSDFGGGERKERYPEGDGKIRDFGNWERKGPLSPIPGADRGGPREGGRPRTNDGPKGEGFRDRRSSPAAWGEGRPQGSQDGSRPPRREFQERPVVERTPTAAEQDNQWRTKMRPDAPTGKSPVPSRDGSEAPSSPAPSHAQPAGRPKLNLAKRTVSEAPLASPSSTSGDAKASPFGAARPIDTAAKEREIEEKRLAAIQEKKEAEEKTKEEKRLAVQAAKEVAETQASEKEAEGEATGEIVEKENANGDIIDDKAVKPKEIVRDAKPKPSETGAWRRPSGGPPPPRDDIPRGPRGGRGGRSRGEGRGGPRHFDDRPRNYNQNGGASPAAPASPATEPEAAAPEEDGWSTVSKPKKNNRGGNQGSRAIAS